MFNSSLDHGRRRGICRTSPASNGAAQEFDFFDNFDDGDISSGSDGFALSQCASWMVTRSSISAESGDLVVESEANGSSPNGWIGWCATRFSGEQIPRRDEWSVRMLATVHDGEIYVGALPSEQHVGIMDNGATISVGTTAIDDITSRHEPMPYSFYGDQLYFQMDSFDGIVTGSIWQNGNPNSRLQFRHPYEPSATGPGFGIVQGTTTFHELRVSSEPIPINILPGDFDGNKVVDAGDIDSLVQGFATQSHQFDVTNDGTVDLDDHRIWVKDFANTYFGDANLDGEFNSVDFVQVFQLGKYETGQGAGWGGGDWDGDGVFSSGDFIIAFQDGGYEQGPLPAVAVVPEPTSMAILTVAMCLVSFFASRVRETRAR